MSGEDLARFQFASTSIYHFLFVPITIGLSFLVALPHTVWSRSGRLLFDPRSSSEFADERTQVRDTRVPSGDDSS
jgi:cytochrome bd-type quinol oxidase subunit 1